MEDQKAREDLELIRRMMEESRRVVVDRGKHFLIWGVLSTVGLVATYVNVAEGGEPYAHWVWLGVLALGWTSSMVVGWRSGRESGVSTPARRILSTVWVAMAIALTLVGLAGMFGSLVSGRALPGLMSVMLAPPVLVSAVLTGERWLGFVAAGWWLGGAVMLFVPGIYTLLLMAAMALLLLALPGAVLYARSRGTGGAAGAITEPA